VLFGTAPGTEAYWDVIAYILSQYPSLDAQGISCYSSIATSFVSAALNITSPVDGFYGLFTMPLLHPSNSSDSLTAAVNTLFTDAMAPYPAQFFSGFETTLYPDFWGYYAINNGPLDAGHDQVLGSRLLDGKALTQNSTALKNAFKTATPPGHITSVYIVAGKNVQHAQPRGGSNAVNPAWRKAFVHTRKPLPHPSLKSYLA
jgi:hypothetical protein